MTIWKKAISVGTSAALLASLLVTAVAPAAFASTAVTSAGTIARGTTSATAATFTFTENSAPAFTGAGTLTVTILDSAAGATVHFTGTPVLVAPGSLGASVAVADNAFTVTTTGQDPINVEQITVSGLKISADIGAATGAIQAALTGSLRPGVISATATATGTLQNAIVVGGTSATVNLTSTCNFVVTGGLNGTVNFSDTSDPLNVTLVAGTPTTPILTIAPATAAHSIGATLTQTVANCTPGALASPGTVADVVVQTATSAPVVPGEQNQTAGTTTITELTAGYIAAGTLTFTLSPAGVLFSASPTVGVTVGNLALSASTCNLSFDRTSCSVGVSAASSAASAVRLSNIKLDVASTVAPGSSVKVAVTASPAINVSVTSNTIAIVGRVIVGVAAQPTIFINYNDQSTGLISLTEQGAGFFTDGTGSNNTFGLCLETGESFTRLPYAVVTAGDLKLLSGVVGGTSVLGRVGSSNSCVYWTVYSASTAASTIEIRGSDSTGAVLPTGATNGPRLSVPAGLAPGTTQASILVGMYADVFNDTPAAFSSLVSFATRAFKSGVVVTALSQPLLTPGTADGLAGNLTIAETLNGQFKPGQIVCVGIEARASNYYQQDTWFKLANTSDQPVLATNAASGLLVSSVTMSPSYQNMCAISREEGTSYPYMDSRALFAFQVNQQSFGGTLGLITISNLHYTTDASAVAGPVLVRVWNATPTTGVDFETVVSNAKIGAKTKLSIGAVSALGLNPTSGYTTKTPKTQAVGKYITWKFTGGTALAGQRVNVLMATKVNGAWTGPKYYVSRWADANGIVTFTWKSATAKAINVRVQWPGNANYAVSVSKALGAYWK